MNKDKLQAELLAKIKPGTKPSDFKKPKRIIKPNKDYSSDEGYESDSSDKIPTPPPLPNSQIKELQKQVKFYSTTANNHLKNLQLAQAKITSLEEQIQNLKKLKTPPKETELLAEKNKQIEIIARENEKSLAKVKELEQTIIELKNQVKSQANINPEPTENKTFTCAECNQAKPHSELSRAFNKFSFCLTCSKKARQAAVKEKTIQEPQPQLFTCVACDQEKQEIPNYKKVEISYKPQLIKGKLYPVCSACLPHIKEYNEHEDYEFSIGED